MVLVSIVAIVALAISIVGIVAILFGGGVTFSAKKNNIEAKVLRYPEDTGQKEG